MQLPQEFIDSLGRCRAPWTDTLLEALGDRPSVSVRLNRHKTGPGDRPADAAGVSWCGDGFYLRERPGFTFDTALHQGLYYVQDASSMFVSHAVRQLVGDTERPLKVLDACAAPGGKTTAIIDALPEGSSVVANEYVPQRAAVLRENLAKWGYPLVAVTQGDTSRFRDFPGAFDIVAADVPCSGEGMMRKDEEARRQWSPDLVRQCAARQREILSNLWIALRPGGYLIYSTCTFNLCENEDMVRWLMTEYGAEPVAVNADASWNLAPALADDVKAWRFIPGLIEGEGLFMAVVRKTADGPVPPVRRKEKSRVRQSGRQRPAPVPDAVRNWLDDRYPAMVSVDENRVFATFLTDSPVAPRMEIGTVKGRYVIPSQELAMSQALRRGAFREVEIERSQAIDYLRCEAITLPPETPSGIVLLTCGGHPLGFAKNLGNRANNLYPKQWRILSQKPSTLPEPVLPSGNEAL